MGLGGRLSTRILMALTPIKVLPAPVGTLEQTLGMSFLRSSTYLLMLSSPGFLLSSAK